MYLIKRDIWFDECKMWAQNNKIFVPNESKKNVMKARFCKK